MAEKTISKKSEAVVEEVAETKTTITQKAKDVVGQVQATVEENITVPSTLDSFMEHQKKAFAAAADAFKALVPEDVRKHAQVAINESFEGYRQLFNTAVEGVASNVEKAKIQVEETEVEETK